LGDLKTHRHAAAWQGEHQHIRAAGIRSQLLRQMPASVYSIQELHVLLSA
jgi:hypothetical protein